MSRTLFGYIFWDLLRIFLLTSGVLSAIMNFGGLLRPLYEHGLDIGQVVQILAYAGPAMTAYSLPIAALFATTIVYGRFGADNEVTACRAAGISHLSMAMPAFVLGLITAFASIGLLCFIVPMSMLKVEKIIYSNIAMLASSEIERTHQIRFAQSDRPGITVFAQSASVLPVDPQNPRNQAVQFIGPLIVEYEKPAKNDKSRIQVPGKFYTAQSAIAYLQQEDESDELSLTVRLFEGTTFPRSTPQSSQEGAKISVGATTFGPMPLPSPIPENEKFMDLFRLQEMLKHPERSQRVRTLLRDFDRRDQQDAYLAHLEQQLNTQPFTIEIAGENDAYRITRAAKPAEMQKERLVLTGTNEQPVRLVQFRGTQPISVEANDLRIRAFPDLDRQVINVEIEMSDCVVTVGGIRGLDRQKFPSRLVTVPIPPQLRTLTTRPASEYIKAGLSPEDSQTLWRNIYRLYNKVVSELHARMSFAVSCFILVMVGCALGLMFRSGNFLSAFAVSVIPALLSIALIVTGQHTCENVPSPLPANWNNAQQLAMGVALIWSGNTVVLAIAVTLLAKLQRR